jgi:hypothetical protein
MSEKGTSQQQPGAEQLKGKSLAAALAETPGPSELFAVVNADGTLARGLYAVSSTRFAPGEYEVIFNRDVTRGVFVASIGDSGSSGIPPAGMITTVGRAGNPNGVFIATYSLNGSFADHGFHLAVLSLQGFAAP